MQNGVIFAEVPQKTNKNEWRLREFRKLCTKKNDTCGSSANNVQRSETVFLHDNKTARNDFIACRLVAALPEGLGNGVALFFLLVAFGMGLESYSFGSSCIGGISCVT